MALHNGVVFGYNAANLSGGTKFYFQTSLAHGNTSSYGGGIWQGGAGPAFGPDANGKNWIYLNTGNGTFNLSSQQPTDAGDSFLKLDPNGLTVTANNTGYFSPADQFYRTDPSCDPIHNGTDMDFGSGGVMLIPDNEMTGRPPLAVSGDKEQALWFMDRTTPGGHITSCDANCNCTAQDSNIVQKYPANNGMIHNGLAFWESPTTNYVYAAGFPGGPLVQYALCIPPTIPHVVCGALKASAPVNPPNFNYGATPAVSASAPETATDAVVWAINKKDGNLPKGTTPGVLFAIDAVSMEELYDSEKCTVNGVFVDRIAPATKFSVPTVANSFVYVGSQALDANGVNQGLGTLYIFGTLSRTCN